MRRGRAAVLAELGAGIAALRDEVRRLGAPPEAPVPPPDPVTWYQGLTGNRLDPWQADYMRSPEPQVLLNCGRQVGKTEAAAAKASHRALFWPRRVGILSPTLRQSGIMYRRCRRLLALAGAAFGRITLSELEMPHGGAIVAFPGDRPDLTVRGDTLDDLIVDEASRIKDAMIAAASPTLATRPWATRAMLSTPAGRRGEFYREWERGEGWRRFRVLSAECPRIRPEFLERERRRLGPLFSQEYEAAFLSDGFGLFAEADLDAMFAQVPLGTDLPDLLEADDDPRELVF